MLLDVLLIFLFAGLPYYLYLEKRKTFSDQKILFLTSFFVFIGIIIDLVSGQISSTPFIFLAFISSLYAFYRATKTTNFYKLLYLILFFNAPVFLMFESYAGALYALSLLTSILGIFLMAKSYDRFYGSANYQPITGLTLVAPYSGLFLTIYLTALALYPPFANSILFFNAIMEHEATLLWYLIVIVVFFGNFFIAARVMAKTVFGKPNPNVHYQDISPKQRWQHVAIVLFLLLLSLVGSQEIFS